MHDFLGFLAALFAVATAIAGGLAGLMYGGQRTLRANNDDLTKRVDILEKERAEDKIVIERQAVEIEALGSQIRGDAKLDSLAVKLDEHHGEATDHWDAQEELMQAQQNTLQQILNAVSGGTS